MLIGAIEQSTADYYYAIDELGRAASASQVAGVRFDAFLGEVADPAGRA
jgi:hypothetical protein